jgi:catechol 2,3-dioxygenase-like lactoylglutathione lyase family enzyme
MPAPIATDVDFLYVFAKDYDAVAAFYENVLGMRCLVRYGRARGAEFACGNSTFVVFDGPSIGIDFVPNKHPIALRVEDFDAAKARLESSGVEFNNVIDSGVCHMAFFNDPDGNALLIHHRYESEDED